jgi:two-component system NarL family sensor kinase
MKLRQKIILLAIAPLIPALCAIAFAVQHEAVLLARQQRAAVENAYIASKEEELRHYVSLATHAIDHLYQSGKNDEATLNEAKAIISKLDYGGDDGYFFIYDRSGTSVMHPRQLELVGRNHWNLTDQHGNPTIQKLLARADAGGGLERYLWEKPSTGKVAPKLGYVVKLDRWGWMLGTGLYLDDVDAALAQIDAQSSKNIYNTMLWIAGITVASAFVIALCGLALNLSEYKVADAKLKALAQRVVRSQEEERARLSRDLHDGISQMLVSIKLQVESAVAKLSRPADGARAARGPLDRAAAQLNDVLGEVRRISHDLRPAILDDLGLAAALDHLRHEFAEHTRIPAVFETRGVTDGLSDVSNTVLFRVAQEALTNIKRHANASKVHICLTRHGTTVGISIRDDGCGFDVARVAKHPRRGIGLRNMHERLEAVGGQLDLQSCAEGTQVTAILPRG